MFIKFCKFFLPTRLFQPTCLLDFTKLSLLHLYSNLHLYSELKSRCVLLGPEALQLARLSALGAHARAAKLAGELLSLKNDIYECQILV